MNCRNYFLKKSGLRRKKKKVQVLFIAIAFSSPKRKAPSILIQAYREECNIVFSHVACVTFFMASKHKIQISW